MRRKYNGLVEYKKEVFCVKKGKRLIALLLAVVLTVGILPATAHAAEDDNLIDLHIDGTQDY